MTDPNKTLDFNLVKEPLETLLIATANKLDREWDYKRYPDVDSARVVFVVRVRLVINTYKTILYTCAEFPKDPLRDKKMVLAVAPLVRSLFEELSVVIFLLHDIPEYVPYLFKTGYTERWLELQHCLKFNRGKPEWDQYIYQLQVRMKEDETLLELTKSEIAHPDSTIGRFPPPTRIPEKLRKKHPTSDAIDFLERLNSWIYRRLSGLSHLDAPAVIRRGIHFSNVEDKRQALGDDYEENLKNLLSNFHLEMMYTTFTLLLAITSEIEGHFRYGLNKRAKYLWQIFSESSDIAKDFYESRYRNLLS